MAAHACVYDFLSFSSAMPFITETLKQAIGRSERLLYNIYLSTFLFINSWFI